MPEHFIILKCQSCGGSLEIYEDMNHFACGYCGSEMMVQRRGGTVALKAVTDAIQKVQIGTDQTAAELAINRLQHEMRQCAAQRNVIVNAPLRLPPTGQGSLLLALMTASLGTITLIGFISTFEVMFVFYTMASLVLTILFWKAYRNNKDLYNAECERLHETRAKEISEVEKRLAELNDQLRQKKAIVGR